MKLIVVVLLICSASFSQDAMVCPKKAVSCKMVSSIAFDENGKVISYYQDGAWKLVKEKDPCAGKPASSAVISNEGTVTGATYDNVHNYNPCGVGVQNKAPVKGSNYNNVTTGPKK